MHSAEIKREIPFCTRKRSETYEYMLMLYYFYDGSICYYTTLQCVNGFLHNECISDYLFLADIQIQLNQIQLNHNFKGFLGYAQNICSMYPKIQTILSI